MTLSASATLTTYVARLDVLWKRQSIEHGNQERPWRHTIEDDSSHSPYVPTLSTAGNFRLHARSNKAQSSMAREGDLNVFDTPQADNHWNSCGFRH
jgi:hypothetical protein